MGQVVGWTIVLLGFVAPLLHVVVSPRAGPWTAPAGAGCPIGPRLGWIVVVLILGLVGWAMFMWRTRRSATA